MNISIVNNREGPNDNSKNHSHLVIYSNQWELHVTVGHFSSLEQCILTEPAFADSACLHLIRWTCLYHLDREMWGTRFADCDSSHHYWTRQSERRKTLGRPKCWSWRQNVNQHKFEEHLLWQLKMYLSRPMGVFKKVLYLSLLLIMKCVYCCYFGQMSQS